MINNLKIASTASYDTNGIDISELKTVNFFYGGNGCGKTTLSNFLAYPDSVVYEQCSTSWEGGRALKTLVYNKCFREQNFGSGEVAGVFTLGEATTEDIQHINDKKRQVSDLRGVQVTQQATIGSQQARLDDLIEAFTNDCWAVYKQYEGDLKETLRGSINTKPNLRDRVLAERQSNGSQLLTLDMLISKSDTLLGEQPVRIDTVPLIPSHENLTTLESSAIWQQVIVGKTDVDIAGLILKLGNSDWINQGRAYIQENDNCPFCQQPTIGDVFRGQIEEYFDESFEQDKARVTANQVAYLSLTSAVLETLDRIETTEASKIDSKLDVEKFSAHLRALHSQISENKLKIQDKLEKTSQQVELTSTAPDIEALTVLIRQANDLITLHNKLVANFNNEVAALKQSAWRFMVEQLTAKITAHEQRANGLQRGIDSISSQISTRSTEISSLDAVIVDLGKNVTSVQPAVDEINRLLRAYGFTNFSIVPSPNVENYYSIQRENGELALETLSEGEITFITFLYFVQLTKGGNDEGSVTDDRVLVIDDPISSLDSNILYVVSTIVKDLIRSAKDGSSNIKQLFLLTHNVYFHKEASFIGSRSNGDTRTGFWILRKNQNITSLTAYGMINPIESSYELLWREIKDWQRNSGITLQNSMRRIVENYFKILGKLDDPDLVDRFETFEEQQICRSLISWINDGSHSIPDDLYVQTPDDSADRYLAVFKKVFEYTNNIGHYEMMMGDAA
jgi:wobble nucleotide-excising tRNase